MSNALELEARVSAMELVLLTHVLQSGLDNPTFDPRAFAAGRRDTWATLGKSMCESCTSETEQDQFTRLYAGALERLGHLLVELAEPVHEAIEEFDGAQGDQGGPAAL